MATRSWKYYRAKAEKIRERNIFPSSIDADQDQFVHYHRDAEAGLDYFGVFTTNQKAWRDGQPTELALTEIPATDIPRRNKHTALAEVRRAAALKSAATETATAKCEDVFAAELARKGLPTPSIVAAAEDVTIKL